MDSQQGSGSQRLRKVVSQCADYYRMNVTNWRIEASRDAHVISNIQYRHQAVMLASYLQARVRREVNVIPPATGASAWCVTVVARR